MGKLLHEAVTKTIISSFYDVYNELGHGFLEAVYRNALRVEFEAAHLRFSAEVPIDVWYREARIGHYRADFLVDDRLVVEVKATAAYNSQDWRQLHNYVRATRAELGLLLHFGMRPRFERILGCVPQAPEPPSRTPAATPSRSV